jgi:CHAT domain-containing protein
VISLPTGLLQAGVAGIIASLWSVDDLSTTMLITCFYYYWQSEDFPPSQALSKAQRWIRSTTNGEKKAFFATLKTRGDAIIPTSVADYLYKAVLWSNPAQNNFAHPYYWASFTYVGA